MAKTASPANPSVAPPIEPMLAKASPLLRLTPATRDRETAIAWLAQFEGAGVLHHAGITSSFTMARRRGLAQELAPLRKNALTSHPWRDRAEASAHETARMPGAQSRWSGGKDLSWEPLRPERVAEVNCDHLQGGRFRQATTFLRWRPDKPPADCRYGQLETAPAFGLERVFGAATIRTQ